MNKKWLCLGLGFLLCGCGSSKEPVKTEGSGTHTSSNGEVTTAKVELEDGKIKDVDIDETAKGKDKTKKELGDDYNMKQASPISKEWDEQVDFFEDYVEKNGVDKIKVNADGKAENDDVKSGCTISVDGFIEAIKDGEKNAK